MRLTSGDGREHDVELLSRDGSRIRARIDGREINVETTRLPDGGALLNIDGRRRCTYAFRRMGAMLVAVGNLNYEFVEADEDAARRIHGLATPEVTAPMPGKVLKILVSKGDAVNAGDGLIVLEAMKMETTLAAESTAVVKRVLVKEGEMVDHGALLLELSPARSVRESEIPNP
ncbi:MAG: acetyl-CoA carboxylase biotin carboxyl carrier protein subunit [Candidatus Binataceae bacterium]